MQIIIQFAILFALTLLGDVLSSLLPFSFPGNILGMCLLLAFLYLKWLRTDQLALVADFLLKNMAFFFIPAGVNILKNKALFRESLFQILIVCILSTMITFTMTALTAKAIMTYQSKRRNL